MRTIFQYSVTFADISNIDRAFQKPIVGVFILIWFQSVLTFISTLPIVQWSWVVHF